MPLKAVWRTENVFRAGASLLSFMDEGVLRHIRVHVTLKHVTLGRMSTPDAHARANAEQIRLLREVLQDRDLPRPVATPPAQRPPDSRLTPAPT